MTPGAFYACPGTPIPSMNNSNRISKDKRVRDDPAEQRELLRLIQEGIVKTSRETLGNQRDDDLTQLQIIRDRAIEEAHEAYERSESARNHEFEEAMKEVAKDPIDYWMRIQKMNDRTINPSGGRLPPPAPEVFDLTGPHVIAKATSDQVIAKATLDHMKDSIPTPLGSTGAGHGAPVANMSRQHLPSPAASVASPNASRVNAGKEIAGQNFDTEPMTDARREFIKHRLANAKRRAIAGPFKKPVCSSEYPNYHELVLQPMDLRTITEKLGTYNFVSEYVRDLDLIVQATRDFNPAAYWMTEDAAVMTSQLKGELKSLPGVDVPGKTKTKVWKRITFGDISKAGPDPPDFQDDEEDLDYTD